MIQAVLGRSLFIQLYDALLIGTECAHAGLVEFQGSGSDLEFRNRTALRLRAAVLQFKNVAEVLAACQCRTQPHGREVRQTAGETDVLVQASIRCFRGNQISH